MKSNREPAWMCWRCGYTMDGLTCMTGEADPVEGDLTVCLNCGSVDFRHSNQWRPATSMEIATLSDDEHRMIDRLERARASIVRTDLSKKEGHA